MKTCRKCLESLPETEFYREKKTKDGLRTYCKPCVRSLRRADHYKNKERNNAYSLQYMKDHPEKKKEYQKRWAPKRPRHLSRLATRRHQLKERIPAWNDPIAEEFVYYAATVVEDVYGGEVTVDHIVPIKGERVSGLHVHTNLRLMSRDANMRKFRKWQT